jgi:hypothetical protein
MNGLSDTLTIGLVLALVFGALFFYLYSRIGQVEKRISLTENILLDLKMATENTMMAMASVPMPMPMPMPSHSIHNHEDEQIHHVEAIGQPEPVEKEEIEQIPDEDFYKQVLEQQTAPATPDVSTTNPVEVNYEAMTLKELKAEAKRKGVAVSANAPKKDVIDALKRQGRTVNVLEPVPGTDGELEEGFPVLGEEK